MKKIVGFKQYKATCSDCSCIFIYEPSDVESDKVNSYVTCPHCGRHVPHVIPSTVKKDTEKEKTAGAKTTTVPKKTQTMTFTKDDIPEEVSKVIEELVDKWAGIWD